MYIGETSRIKHMIVDAEGEFLADESPTFTVIRDSDGYIYEFTTTTFVASGGTQTQDLTEDSTNEYYYYDWIPPGSEIANETYFIKIINTGDYADISAGEIRYIDEPADSSVEATLEQIMSTSAGGFDRETDSLQAIRDRGDMAWRQVSIGCMWSTDSVEEIFKKLQKMLDNLKEIAEELESVPREDKINKSLEEIGKIVRFSENLNRELKNVLGKVEGFDIKMDTYAKLLDESKRHLFELAEILKNIEGNGSHELLKLVNSKINTIEQDLKLAGKLLAKIVSDEGLEEVLKEEVVSDESKISID